MGGLQMALLAVAALGVVDGLKHESVTMPIIIGVVAAVGLALGGLAAVFLGRIMGRHVRGAITSISNSTAELLAVASQVASATAQTAAATTETTVTVEEVKQTAMLAQEKAHQASELSQTVVGSSKFGETSCQKNLDTFDRIHSDMGVVSDAIDRLNEQAESVGDIIATVNDLAEQSNLLSVNASIEAAKAGEYGKGFTVVAQEVKSLAVQSKQAVAQVRAVLSEIQKAAGIAVRAGEQALGAVEAGRGEAAQAMDGTRAEVDIASSAAEATAQIAATSRQQLAGMEQISSAIMSINEAGAQSVSGARLVEREAKQLQQLARSLGGLVDRAVDETGSAQGAPIGASMSLAGR
jgi:methyl-accepting chemotaxis protein